MRVIADLLALSAFVWNPITHVIQISHAAQPLPGKMSPRSTDDYFFGVHSARSAAGQKVRCSASYNREPRTDECRYLHPYGRFRQMTPQAGIT